jgi:site-specific DNA recombinase
MRAFVYCRVSSKEQASEDHYSLDNQEQRCRDYIKMKQWRCSSLRKDVASGKNDDRIGFQNLLSSIRDGKVDVVVVYRLDRLSRNVRDIYDFLDMIKASGVAFVSVTEGFDTTTAMGRAMLGVAAVFAQLTREMISENTKDGLLRRRESGQSVGPVTRTYGYDYFADKGGLIVNEQEAKVIHQIFDWYTEHKWGGRKIAQLLNLQGVPTKTGVQWGENSIRAILSNPLVSGQLRLKAEGRVVEGQQEAIISREQFDLAQEILSGRQKYPNRSQQSKYLLSGLARCGNCGRRLAAHTIYQGKKRTPYTFYHHSANGKVGEGSCSGLSKSMHLLESGVLAQINELSRSGTMEKVILQDVKNRKSKEHLPKIKERDKILLELKAMDEKFTQWADRLDSGKIDEDQFERQNQRLLARKKELQARMQELDEEVGKTAHLEVSLNEVRKVLADFPTLWETLEHEERQEVLRLLVEELKVFKTHAEMKLLFLDPIQFPLISKTTKKADAEIVEMT